MIIKNNKKNVTLGLNKDKTLKPVNLNGKTLPLKDVKANLVLKKGTISKPRLQKKYVNILPMKPSNYTLRYFPAAIRVFLNSVYSFNKSFVKNLPVADNIVYKILKGYFTLNLLSNNKQGKKSRLLVRRYKKLSLNRIIVSKPEIKHSSDHVMITLYVYNKKKHSIIYRLKQLYKSIIQSKQESILVKGKAKKNIFKVLHLSFKQKANLSQEKENKKRILNLIKVKKNNFLKRLALKKKSNKKLKALMLKKNKNFSGKLIMKKAESKKLMLNTSSRYNLKMNYLLNQDREYTASFRSFNYAKKKIYIVICRKFNFYKKNTDLNINEISSISNLYNAKKRFKNLKRNLYINNTMITSLPLRKKQANYVVIRLIKIKPRIKDVKIKFNILMYRNANYINKRKRKALFNKFKAKIIYIRSRNPILKKIYHNAIKFKKINNLSFNHLANHGLALQSNIKNRVLLYSKNKMASQEKEKSKIFFKASQDVNRVKLERKLLFKKKSLKVKKSIITKKTNSIKRNLLTKIYKPINNFKKYYPYRSLARAKNKRKLNGLNYNNKYISSLKFKYNPYKGLNTNFLNSISLLNKLNKIDFSFFEKTMKYILGLNDIMFNKKDNSKASLTSGYRGMPLNDYNNAKQKKSLYVKYKNLLKVKLLNELLQREMLYTYYIRSLYINNLVFKSGFINNLCNIISKVYNKKVKLNIVSLKYLYLNSDIFTQAITTRLKNHRKNRLTKVLGKVFALVYLAKINEYAYNIHSPIYKYIEAFNNKYMNLRSHLAFTSNSFVKLNKNNSHSYPGRKHNVLKKLPGMPLYNLNHILFNQINFIKCKSVFGIKLEAKGRLTKRSTASRKVFKVKYLGNLRYNNILNRNNNSYIIKNNIISNIQFAKIAGKTRIGSFGIKGWINNN